MTEKGKNRMLADRKEERNDVRRKIGNSLIWDGKKLERSRKRKGRPPFCAIFKMGPFGEDRH